MTAQGGDAHETPEALLRRTLAFYESNAEAFRAGTCDHDVSQNIEALLSAIEGAPPFSILDFGCGPGRDLAAFRARGHEAVGLDACEAFARMAEAELGAEVWVQDFLALDLPPERFDGIFANAALFHVPAERIANVLGRLRASLRPRGVLFSSNPRGNDEQGFAQGRFACFWSEETWCRLVSEAGFEEITRYWRPPGRPRPQQPWFATVWRKAGS